MNHGTHIEFSNVLFFKELSMNAMEAAENLRCFLLKNYIWPAGAVDELISILIPVFRMSEIGHFQFAERAILEAEASAANAALMDLIRSLSPELAKRILDGPYTTAIVSIQQEPSADYSKCRDAWLDFFQQHGWQKLWETIEVALAPLQIQDFVPQGWVAFWLLFEIGATCKPHQPLAEERRRYYLGVARATRKLVEYIARGFVFVFHKETNAAGAERTEIAVKGILWPKLQS